MDLRTRITFQRTGLPRRFWQKDLHPDEVVMDWAAELYDIMYDETHDNFGQGLVLCGPGATRNAAWLFVNFLKTKVGDLSTCLFVDWATFIDEVADREERGAAVDEAIHPHLLIFDQVSLNRAEWISSVLTRVVKSRYDGGRPTILTTSKPLDLAQNSLASCFDFDPHSMKFVGTLGSEG